MAKLTAEQFQEKHNRRLKAAIEDMRLGVSQVSESPTSKAAKKADKMVANLTASVHSGKWAAGLNRVSLDQWKTQMIDKGLPRVATGIDGAADKVKAFASDFLPFLDGVKAKVEKMPDVTLEDNISRMTAAIREIAKYKRK